MNPQKAVRTSFRDFLNIVFKWKYQMALFFIITVCTIVGITFSIQPQYRASGQISLNLGSRNVYTLPGLPTEELPSFNRISIIQSVINTEKEFLQSHFLSEKVLRQLESENIISKEKNTDKQLRWHERGIFQNKTIQNIKNLIFRQLHSEPAEELDEESIDRKRARWLQLHLSVQGISTTNIMRISFTDGNPERAAEIVNTFMETYLEERLQLNRNVQSRTFFKDQSLELKTRLEEAEKELEQFKNANNITDLNQQQSLLLQQISNLQVALNDTLSKITETDSRIALIKKQLDRTPETIPQGAVTDHNEILMSRLQATLVDLQIEEKELLNKYTPQSRMVSNVRERITIVESKIKEQENNLTKSSSFGVNTTYLQLKQQLLNNEAELEALRAKKDALNTQLTDFQNDKETFNRIETRFNELQQSVELYRTNYKLYAAKLEASRIEDAMDSEKISDVTIMNRAIPPMQPFSPNYRFNIILSVLIGGLGALILAIVCDYMDDSLETPEDVENTLQLAVLTSIPDISSSKRLDHKTVSTSPSDLSIQVP